MSSVLYHRNQQRNWLRNGVGSRPGREHTVFATMRSPSIARTRPNRRKRAVARSHLHHGCGFRFVRQFGDRCNTK